MLRPSSLIPSNSKLIKKIKKGIELSCNEDMIQCSKGLSSEWVSNLTTIESDKDNTIRKNKALSVNSCHSFEFIGHNNCYKLLYKEKCSSLELIERKFNQLNKDVIEMIQRANETNYASQQQINNLKDLVMLIMGNYSEGKYGILDYINAYFNKNLTIFCKDNTIEKTIATESNYYLTSHEYIKNVGNVEDNHTIINYDEDFWMNSGLNQKDQDDIEYVSEGSKPLAFYISKELKEFLNKKLKSFLLQ